jgi:hypothetical protein
MCMNALANELSRVLSEMIRDIINKLVFPLRISPWYNPLCKLRNTCPKSFYIHTTFATSYTRRPEQSTRVEYANNLLQHVWLEIGEPRPLRDHLLAFNDDDASAACFTPSTSITLSSPRPRARIGCRVRDHPLIIIHLACWEGTFRAPWCGWWIAGKFPLDGIVTYAASLTCSITSVNGAPTPIMPPDLQ